MFDPPRRYNEIVWMSFNYISLGFADGRISDGRSCRLQRLADGRWEPILRGIPVWEPLPTYEAAFSHLEHAMAAEGLWLRRGP